MFKKNKKIKTNTIISENNPTKKDLYNIPLDHPYYHEIMGYLDLRSYDLVTIAAQRNAILLLIIVILFLVTGITWIGVKSKFIPMVFYTDRNGSMVYGGIATEKLVITEPMVEDQLVRYIEALRQVPTDLAVRTEYVRKVKMLSDSSVYHDVAVPTFEERYKEGAPNIYIKIRNILPINDTAYQIDWDETVAGSPITISWKASISFTMNNEIDDPLIRIYNPLGIQINGLNINQEIQK
ncbi:MAG: type IV secretion system protein [Sphingobacteriaceae bacterium]|nr:type IV secretion system protein [Sphingobacteriaceae bacterium]